MGEKRRDGTFPVFGPHAKRPRISKGSDSRAVPKELALRLMRLYVGAQYGIDAGVLGAFATGPAQQVGIKPHVTASFGVDNQGQDETFHRFWYVAAQAPNSFPQPKSDPL